MRPPSKTLAASLLCLLAAAAACGDDEPSGGGAAPQASNNGSNNSDSNNTANNAPVNNAANNAPVNNTANNAPANNAPPEPPRYVQLIRSDTYTKLVLELDAVPGRGPRPAAKAALVEALEALLDKPGGITWVEDGALSAGGEDYGWPFEEIDELARGSFDLEVPADTIKLQVLYVDGHADADAGQTRILGQAWRYTHLVIYADTLDATCSSAAPLPTFAERFCVTAETTILIHEVGHLIGLVDNGLEMQTPHRDADHGRHDSNAGCLMYWAYNGPDFFSSLSERFLAGEESVPGFDQACLDDVAAVRDAPP